MASGDSPMMASVALWPADFAPRNWSFCHGQLISINQNQALFALLGDSYGGDMRTTFGIPDMRGRLPIGAGQSAGTSFYRLGEKAGVETHTLTLMELPVHNHNASFGTQPGFSGSLALPVKTGLGSGSNDPNGKYIGPSGSTNMYYDAPTDNTSLGVAPVNIESGIENITIDYNGSSEPVDFRQPFLALNYIICVEGIFPSRN